MFWILSEKYCWVILPKKVSSQYRSETLLKQISLQLFLNYCSNILVVGLLVISQGFSDFSRSRSSDPKAFCKKIFFFFKFRIQSKTLVPEPFFKDGECFKKEIMTQVFLRKFYKFLKKCFENLYKDLLLKCHFITVSQRISSFLLSQLKQ